MKRGRPTSKHRSGCKRQGDEMPVRPQPASTSPHITAPHIAAPQGWGRAAKTGKRRCPTDLRDPHRFLPEPEVVQLLASQQTPPTPLMLPSQHGARGGSKAQNRIIASTPTPQRGRGQRGTGVQTDAPQHLPPSPPTVHLHVAHYSNRQAKECLLSKRIILTVILNDLE